MLNAARPLLLDLSYGLFVFEGVFPECCGWCTCNIDPSTSLRSAYDSDKVHTNQIAIAYSCCAAWSLPGLPGSICSTTPTAYYILRRPSHADETICYERRERDAQVFLKVYCSRIIDYNLPAAGRSTAFKKNIWEKDKKRYIVLQGSNRRWWWWCC